MVYKPNAPCFNCPNRKVGCHNSECAKWAKFEQDSAEWNKQERIRHCCEDLAKTNIGKYSKPHSNEQKTDINFNS